MLSGGSGEVEAAKLRLAAAKSKKESALEMVKSAHDMNKTAEVMTSSARDMTDKAKAMMDAATAMTNTARINTESAKAMANMAKNNMTAGQSQLDTTNKEISEADAMLKRVEEKWQVIDVDDSPKKAEKSSDATTNNNDVNGSNQAAAGDIIDVSSLASTRSLASATLRDIVGARAATTQSDVSSLASTRSTVSESDMATLTTLLNTDSEDTIDLDAEIAAGLQAGNGHSLSAAVAVAAACNFTGNIQQVLIKGCGTKGANGTYKRDPNFIGSTHCNSFTRKKKQSSKNTYALYRKDMYWYLSIWTSHSVTKTLYRTMNRSNTGLPPESGWMSIEGASPAPKLSM